MKALLIEADSETHGQALSCTGFTRTVLLRRGKGDYRKQGGRNIAGKATENTVLVHGNS